jgi:hypothetical protein
VRPRIKKQHGGVMPAWLAVAVTFSGRRAVRERPLRSHRPPAEGDHGLLPGPSSAAGRFHAGRHM